MPKVYKALHNTVSGDEVFEEGKIYAEADIEQHKNLEVGADFVEVTPEEVEEKNLSLSKPRSNEARGDARPVEPRNEQGNKVSENQAADAAAATAGGNEPENQNKQSGDQV